jgi:hypothetical protein
MRKQCGSKLKYFQLSPPCMYYFLTWLKNKKGCCISHWMTAPNLLLLNKFCAIFASFPGTYILPLHLGILVTVYLCVPCIVERKRMRNNNENRKYDICFHLCLSYVSFSFHSIRFANSTMDQNENGKQLCAEHDILRKALYIGQTYRPL